MDFVFLKIIPAINRIYKKHKMIRIFFFIGFISISFLNGLFAQVPALNKYDQDGKKSGVWESYYESGKIKSHGTFKQGHPVGELLKYYPGGILQANMNFDESGRISYVRLYYEGGFLASDGKYIDQQKDSVWNYYSAYDKQKISSETFKSGKKNGPSFKYYSDGKYSEYLEWMDDQKYGKWEQYFQNGKIRLRGEFVSGLLNGSFTSYNGDGSLSITGKYVNGIMDGIWSYYTETGDPDLTLEYKDGKMLPNPEMDKREEEFAKKIKDAIGNLNDPEIEEFK
jgi:antitoxin component YwqK of YwqJK toxin-antitoxin module